MKKNTTLTYLKALLEHLQYYNNMAPFPVYDTEYVEEVRNKIKEMEEKNNEYDELPVVACRHCKSLHVISDELDNSICMRCGSVNELQEFENIYKYKEFKDGKNS